MNCLEQSVYVLFANPILCSRTGHAAIAITEGHHIIRYFSLYHALKPDYVRKIPTLHRLKSLMGYVVDSYQNDVVMRGQSYVRAERSEKENSTVPELIQNLPTDESIIAHYFWRGQYHYALKIPPTTIDPIAVIKALDDITKSNYIPWTMVAPLGKIYDLRSHNCCSAIQHAVNDGMRTSQNKMVGVLKTFLTIGILSFYGMHSENKSSTPFYYLPILYLLVQLIRAMYHAHVYVNDLKIMAKKGAPDLVTFIKVYSLCMFINALASPFTSNACLSLFIFPKALARSIQTLPGVEMQSSLPNLFKRLSKKSCDEMILQLPPSVFAA